MKYSPASTDIVVRIVPSHGARDSSTRQIRTYDSFVYSHLPLDIGRAPTRRFAEDCQGLPLQGTGQLLLPWSKYQDHLASFYEGEKGIEMMYFRMMETLSPEMKKLVERVREHPVACRVWWGSDAPELDDMPWDILFYGYHRDASPARFTCVRGMPPRLAPPILQVGGPLRFLWFDNPLMPAWLRQLFSEIDFPGITKIRFAGPIREGIQKAVSEGIELMHLSSDGVVSLAYEGVLYVHGERRPEMSAYELSELLSGKRVSVIGLTSQDYSNPDVMDVSGRQVVSAYRAFACFASSKIPLPSIMTPIGPSEPRIASEFWKTFYSHLGASHRLDRALAEAKFAAPASPCALFLRHPFGKLFRSAASLSFSPSAPERMANDLKKSIDATQQVRALGEKYGELPEYLSRFAQEESEHQKSIEADLDQWSTPEGDEQ